MNQADTEMQLKVWKELAVSKQMLMNTVINALGLSSDCTNEELESKVKQVVVAVKKAEEAQKAAEEKAKAELAQAEAKLEEAQKSIAKVEQEKAEALKAAEAANARFEQQKTANAEEVKKLKAQIAQQQKEAKQITKILADTPENVVKKLKTLKKEKMDESKDRKRAEDNARQLKKEKQKLEADLADLKTALEAVTGLIEDHKKLHQLANEQFNKLAEAGDKDSLEPVPALNEELLEGLAKLAEGEKDSKSKSTKKK